MTTSFHNFILLSLRNDLFDFFTYCYFALHIIALHQYFTNKKKVKVIEKLHKKIIIYAKKLNIL